MNRKYKWMIVSVLISFIGINLFFIMNPSAGPRAENGVLDLRGGKFPEQGLASLSGEWGFYPNQLLSGVQDVGNASASTFISVPGNWTKGEKLDHFNAALGYGTYRLKVRIDAEQQGIVSFRVPLIRSSHRLFINGEELSSQGHVSDSRKGYLSQVHSYVAQKDIRASDIDLFIQVSNFDFKPSGGIIQSIQMGSLDAIMKEHQRIAAFEFAIIVVFVILALFFGFIHLRTSKTDWLYLALFFFCDALTVANQGSKWFFELFPDMSYSWFIHIYWFSNVGLTLGMFMFIYNQHTSQINKWFRRLLILFSSIFVCILLLAPISFMSGIIPVWLVGVVGIYCYLIVVLFRSLPHGGEHVKYNLIAFCLFGSNALLNMFIQFGVVEANLLYFVQIIGVSSAFSFIFLNQFFLVYKKTKELSLRLKQADLSRNQFMASISEQMAAPLNAVISIVDARLQSDERLTTDQIHELRLVTAIGWKMRRLVDDLLDFSRWRDEGIVLHVRPLNIQLAADEVIDRLKLLVLADSVTITTNIKPDVLPPVLADEQRLSQILTGLLSLALKFVPNGAITINAEEREHRVHLQITMQGLHTDEQNEWLQTLIQEAKRNEYDNNGSSLGLTLIHALIELHEGTLTAASESSQVASFNVTLPIALESADQHGSGASVYVEAPDDEIYKEVMQWSPTNNVSGAIQKLEWEQDIGEVQVLIIDDDTLSLKMLTAILGLDGYEVITKRNAKEAFQYLHKKGPVDLVIVNRTLPDQSGVEVCRQIRVHYHLFELPILLLTNALYSEHAILSSQAGANDFLAKPIEPSELRVRVRTLLQLKQSVGKRIQMELAFLQAQIKPHFLFNTLNSIVALSKRQPEKMGNLLTEFGDYLRESFRFDSSEPLIPFERELKLIKSYLHIEKVRFEDWLNYDIHIHYTMKFKIPPLTIQPLVENAVRHGIMRRANGGHIQIQIWQEDSFLWIQVKDDGVGMSPEAVKTILQSSSGGIGIRNIDRRLKQLFGLGLIINSNPDQGTDILIQLPIERVGYGEGDRS